MDMFFVSRYGGDEAPKQSANRAADILKKLHQEAESRKSQKHQVVDPQGKGAAQLDKHYKNDQNESDKTGKLSVGCDIGDAVDKSGSSQNAKKKKRKSTPVDGTDSSKKARHDSESSETLEDKTKEKQEKKHHGAETPLVKRKEKQEKGTKKGKQIESALDVNEMDFKQDEESVDAEDKVSEGAAGENGAGFTQLGAVKRKQNLKVHRVLPDWLSSPSIISADIRGHRTALTDIAGLDKDLLKKLQNNGITSFFPVQTQVIPMVLQGVKGGHTAAFRPSDICCSAPTGSGKTLAFVLPIVQSLTERVVCRLRAVVVLPVRDLATQVYKVFATYCEGTRLKVALLTGQKAFSSEQQSLVIKGRRGHHSRVDIVVATPGRLVDHLNKTAGFDLSQLRFLVIDEADRMVEEIKHDWLVMLEQAVSRGAGQTSTNTALTAAKCGPPPTPGMCHKQPQVQKLLFSATLSQNPEKLQELKLFQPKLFTSVDKAGKDLNKGIHGKKSGEHTGDFIGKYTTPSGLTEFYIESSVAEKPLVLLHLLHHLKFKHVLCFTNSVEATHRLFWLLKLFSGIEVQEFSSSLHAQKRNRILRKFSAGKIDILICSDSMARGIDVDNIQYVVSYEMPPFLKTYIHRVGRTARAARVGTAVTLLQGGQVKHFKKMLKEAGKQEVSQLNIDESKLETLQESYQTALQQIPDILKREKCKR